ncbi:MAG TPA: amidohydrolase family protein [Blastocatellia bacterium]|nr:amidohydrolase family protein [Blastocatellia bacterium]
MLEQDPNETIALVGGTVIDGVGGAPLRDAVVIIKDGKILRVGGKGEVPYAGATKVIDVAGKYLLPGLIDLHVHYDGWMGELFLAHGVTTVKDMGNDIEWMSTVSREVEEGKVRGPRIFYVGNGLDAPPPVREHHVGLDNAEMARRAVELLYEHGASAIKVREKITPELLNAITEAAHRCGIPVTGHIKRMDAREAAMAGIDGLEHATGIVQAVAGVGREDEPGANELEKFVAELKAYSLIDLDKVEELVQFLISKRVALIPTMANWWRMASDRRDQLAREDAVYAKDSSLAYVPEFVRQMWATSYVFQLKNADDLAQVQAGYRKLQALLVQFYKSGGKVLAGSDTFFSVPGLSLQTELLFLVDAGFTPMQAIMMATRDNADFLGKGAELGTIAPGKAADLVVLSADPLADIGNIRKVEQVMKGGQVVDMSYRRDYLMPAPKPELKRPLWLERQLQRFGST